MSFSSLNLHESVQHALEATGYTEPTAVQLEAIPFALQGRDLIVSAQTGTGKTAAFMLPALSMIADNPRKPGRGPRILVLTPTRELAQQVTQAAQKYGAGIKNLNTVSVLGGMPFPAQNRLLSRPYDIMVATPGRLLDHMNRGRIVFERLDMLVLDEADRMLDMGFIDDVEHIANACPPDRQTVFFSATFEDRMAKLAATLLKDPHRISISSQTSKHEQIEQRIYFADDQVHKKQLLHSLLTGIDVNQAIVFAGTKIESDSLADELAEMGFAVDALHGDMKQSSRNRTLASLRNGRTKILVATDVAARGIDVPGISHVVNYDLPKNAEDYVHRIGRTGRAGRTGVACSLVGPRDRGVLRRIEHFLDSKFEIQTIEGLEPKRRVDNDRPRQSNDKSRWDSKDKQQRRGNDRTSRSRDSDRPARARSDERSPFQERSRRPDGDRPSFTPQRAAAPASSSPEDNMGNRVTPDFGSRLSRKEPARAPRDFNDKRPRYEGSQVPNESEFGERQRRDFMERTGLGADRRARPANGTGFKPRSNDGSPRPQRNDSAPRGRSEGFGDRPRRDSRSDYSASRPAYGDRPSHDARRAPARQEGDRPVELYERPQRPGEGQRPAIEVKRKPRVQFDRKSDEPFKRR